MRSALTRLLLSLAMLLLCVQHASARAVLQPENRVVGSAGGFAIESWDEWPASADGIGAAAAWGYDFELNVGNGPNLYAYVRQNPWTHFDPEGLEIELSSADVDWSYFTKQNAVTGFNSDWSSKAHHITAPRNFDATNVRSEILATMMASSSTFKFKDTKQLERNVQARVDAIEASAKIQAQFTMSSDRNGPAISFGPKATRDSKTGDLVPNAGVSRLDAMEACLNSKEAAIDCSKAAIFPIQIGMLKAGDTLDGTSQRAGLARRDTGDKLDWVPGDRGRLKDYLGGENIFYLGGEKWRAHGDDNSPLNKGFIQSRTDVETVRSSPSTGLSDYQKDH